MLKQQTIDRVFMSSSVYKPKLETTLCMLNLGLALDMAKSWAVKVTLHTHWSVLGAMNNIK